MSMAAFFAQPISRMLAKPTLRFLNPGGTLELIDIIYPFRSDDGTLSEDSNMYRWSKLVLEGFTANGSAINSALKYKEQLTNAGFIGTTEVKQKWPMGTWLKDEKHKQISGQRGPAFPYFLHRPRIWSSENLKEALSAVSLAVFTRHLGWDAGELDVLLASVREDIKNRNVHAYASV